MFNIINLNNHLDSDEKIIYFFRPSRKAYILGYIIYIILLLTGIFFSGFSVIGSGYFIFWKFVNIATIIITIFSIIMIARLEYRIWSRKYALTTERIFYSKGIFSEAFKSSAYNFITDIKMHQTFWDKILNTGTVVINTAGTDNYEIRYRKISNPIYVKKIINDMQTRHVVHKQTHKNRKR